MATSVGLGAWFCALFIGELTGADVSLVGVVTAALVIGVLGLIVRARGNRTAEQDAFFGQLAVESGWQYMPACVPRTDTALLQTGDTAFGGPGFMVDIAGLGCVIYQHTSVIEEDNSRTETRYVVLLAPLRLAGIRRLEIMPRGAGHRAFAGSRTVEVESEELTSAFTIAVDAAADPARVRSLVSPSFQVQLLDLAQADCYLGEYLQLENGTLMLGSDGTITTEDADSLRGTVRLAAPLIEWLRRFAADAAPALSTRAG